MPFFVILLQNISIQVYSSVFLRVSKGKHKFSYSTLSRALFIFVDPKIANSLSHFSKLLHQFPCRYKTKQVSSSIFQPNFLIFCPQNYLLIDVSVFSQTYALAFINTTPLFFFLKKKRLEHHIDLSMSQLNEGIGRLSRCSLNHVLVTDVK